MGLPEPLQRRLAGPPVEREGQVLAVDTQLMLRLQRVMREPAMESLPIPQGRDAMRRQTALVGGRLPVGAVRDLAVAGRSARLYTPSSVTGRGPLLLFLHGGGWLYGDLDSHDAPCRFLAERAGVRVLAVDYRLAPESPFPGAYDDCLAALKWLVGHADHVDADPARLGIGGDSAGGSLAAAVAIAAAREGIALRHQLLVYPATDMTASSQSRRTYDQGFFLTREFMDLANGTYLPDAALQTDPVASPLFADLPDGLAPAYVCTAGFDPLRDEGEAYARRLEEAGVPVTLRRFEDQIHGFFNVVGVGRTARRANAEIAEALRRALH